MATIARSNFRDVDDSEICRIRMRGRTRLLVLGMQGTGKSSLKRQMESSLFTERNNVGLIESSTVDSELVEGADIICFVVDSTEPKFTENAEWVAPSTSSESTVDDSIRPTLFRSIRIEGLTCLLRDDLPVPCMPRTSRRVRPRIRILQISESSTSLKFDRAMVAMLEEEIAESNWVGGSAWI
ncbi:hypothetical protein C1H46_011997 [Malus baccata]|uniref:Uncharacterized protein n=1 Tax=Malus baccata TaxID=106549 RepID=A0A540MU93_MALBA|nr:hypothetical protein C1H46_011997 [Malus baccata]